MRMNLDILGLQFCDSAISYHSSRVLKLYYIENFFFNLIAYNLFILLFLAAFSWSFILPNFHIMSQEFARLS